MNRFKRKIKLDANDVDFESKFSIPAIMRHFQAAASDHAQVMGMDYFTLKAKSDAFWVITKVMIKINKLPKWGEKVILKTWPLLPSAIKCNRDFEILSPKKEVLVKGTSEWCILDYDTRRPRKVATTCYPLKMKHLEKRTLEDRYGHFLAESVNKNFVYERKIRATDIDLNYHTNNTIYSNLVFDSFSISELKKMEILSYEIHFCSETKEGDLIKIYHTVDNDKNLITGINSNSGKLVFQAALEYKNR
ncbi:MAG TPA: hypothetical protein GX692_08545 [Acholeplasmataceae bacterium]|jgi:acyl-ACP thioesterase|nr:hypothetical protein [Acholeplasmataceae bacterium]